MEKKSIKKTGGNFSHEMNLWVYIVKMKKYKSEVSHFFNVRILLLSPTMWCTLAITPIIEIASSSPHFLPLPDGRQYTNWHRIYRDVLGIFCFYFVYRLFLNLICALYMSKLILNLYASNRSYRCNNWFSKKGHIITTTH